MIRIYTEPHFLEEKKYVFHVLFKELLGIDFTVFTSSVSRQYKIFLPNNATIEINDAFFSQFSETVGYCDIENIPKKIAFFKNNFTTSALPIIYGDTAFNVINEQAICSGIDIIAGAFFMLTRWEEQALDAKDQHGRFDEKQSLAVKHNFIDTPVVHQYADFFIQMAKLLGVTYTLPYRFTKTLTHDIDYMLKWMNPLDTAKTLVGDALKRFSFRVLKDNWQMHSHAIDPYDTFEQLMDISEKNDTYSTFYFLLTTRNIKALSSDKGKRIIDAIRARNHNFGIHLNEWKTSDYEKIVQHIQMLSHIVQKPLTHSRQHFLKLEMPHTLRVLEQAGIVQDSSLYYRNYPGFRTGMCIEHSLFDCEKRTLMNIKELPLTLMDVSLLNYATIEQATEKITKLIHTVKSYNGNFVCLWHNSSFDSFGKQKALELYNHIVNA